MKSNKRTGGPLPHDRNENQPEKTTARGSKAALVLALSFIGPVALSAADKDSMDHRHDMGAVEAHWSAPPDAAKRRNPIRSNGASVEEGKQLFQKYCVSCHGPAGHGDGPAAASLNPRPADLATMAGHHPEGDLAWKIANGRGAMPPWKGTLSDNQIWILVNHIRSLPGAGTPGHDKEHHHH